MKKIVYVITNSKVALAYDLQKVSFVRMIDDTIFQIVIDGWSTEMHFESKEECEQNFNFIITELSKLNENEHKLNENEHKDKAKGYKYSKRKDKETYPQWIQRLLPDLTDKQHELIGDMIKEAWFDGMYFERGMNKK